MLIQKVVWVFCGLSSWAIRPKDEGDQPQIMIPIGPSQIDTGDKADVSSEAKAEGESAVMKDIADTMRDIGVEKVKEENREADEIADLTDSNRQNLNRLHNDEVKAAIEDEGKAEVEEKKTENELKQKEEEDRHAEVMAEERMEKRRREEDEKIDELEDAEAELVGTDQEIKDKEAVQKEELENMVERGKENELIEDEHEKTLLGNTAAAAKEEIMGVRAENDRFIEETAEEKEARCGKEPAAEEPADNEAAKNDAKTEEAEAHLEDPCVPVVNEKSIEDLLKTNMKPESESESKVTAV